VTAALEVAAAALDHGTTMTTSQRDTEMTQATTLNDTSEADAQEAVDADATYRLLLLHRQMNCIVQPPAVECVCGEVIPIEHSHIDFVDAEQKTMLKHQSQVLAAAKRALPDTPNPVHFSSLLRHHSNPAPEGWTEKRWHQDAMLDSGTSHVLVGPSYVIQCEWCPQVFVGERKADAMRLFRAHETEMQ